MPEPHRTGEVAAAYTYVARAVDALLERGQDDAVRRQADWSAALRRPLPEQGVGADAVLAEFVEHVLPNGPQTVFPQFWGWIVTGAPTVPAAVSAAALVASPHRFQTTAFNLVERLSLEWLADLLHLRDGMHGIYSSGGSTANLVALGAARQWAYENQARDVAGSGLDGSPVAVYASVEAHHTIQRSAAVLGLGRACVRAVPVDDQQRMRVDELQRLLAVDAAEGVLPVAVVANAGTTNTGAIDPLRAVGALAQEFGAWFHVDGAYGLPGILDDRVAHLYDGLELADSVIVDPHKWLGAPVGTGATFVRDRALLTRAFMQEPADYLHDHARDDDRPVETTLDHFAEPWFDQGVELTARPRGAAVWAALLELGRDGMAARIRQDDDFARRVADEVRAHPRLELLTEPTLSIVCFRYVPSDAAGVDVDDLNARILHRLHLDGDYLPSSTRVRGAFAIRPCFVNPRTTHAHLDGFTDRVVELGDQLSVRE